MSDNSVEGLKARYGDRWRWLAVATVMLGTMATVLSATVVNVALHDIMLEFGIRQGQVHWLATGFIAAMTMADLAAAAHISCLDYLGDVPWDDYPAVRQWYSVMKSRQRGLLHLHLEGWEQMEILAHQGFTQQILHLGKSI